MRDSVTADHTPNDSDRSASRHPLCKAEVSAILSEIRRRGREEKESDMKRAAVLVGFLVLSLVAALAPPSRQTEAQANCFPASGFCITNPAFADYFNRSGQVRTHGNPVSRSFILEGFEVQIFERIVLQLNAGSVARLNVLDPDILPLTRANQSIFPAPDPALASAAPQAGSADYAQRAIEFIRSVAPNTFEGLPVNFFDTFNTSVPVEPGTSSDIQTLRNLEIWGLPTSRPAFDPGNRGFVYQRFQRGIMHFRAEVPVTEGILIGAYFKAVITAQSLPPDLAQDTQGSRYAGQYNPSAPNSVNRPAALPNTNMVGAFEPGTGAVTPPPPGPAPTAAGPTATTGPTSTPIPGDALPTISTFRVDDDRIDAGDEVEVTLIARDDRGVDEIQFDGIRDNDDSDNDNSNDNDADDPELERRDFDCDDRTECAVIFRISPTEDGDFFLRARARDTAGQRSERTTISLRVRGSSATATPTATPTQTPMPR